MAKNDNIHYFGIRHHGPGSARRLLAALEALQPAAVLVEGPADAGELLPYLAGAGMQPPVAMLIYAAEAPELAWFYPFAEFSPEYQALVWAQTRGIETRFIDLPASRGLAEQLQAIKAAREAAAADTTTDSPDAPAGLDASDADAASAGEGADAETQNETQDTTAEDDSPLSRDPIGAMALAAGYEDGESWWNDWIEAPAQSDDGSDGPLQVFAAVESVMTALREQQTELSPREARREAHMRLEIAAAAKAFEGQAIAVICGAWHVPALKARHKSGDDRTLIAKPPKCKTKMTWVPWTHPRLASGSGYGAGVRAPRWYRHLWRHGDTADWLSRWMVDVSSTLREAGAPVSTASVIEAVRLGQTLAAVRERPRAGFEEMRDATIACLCHGEPVLWNQHARALLLGSEVGQIPDDMPLMPLLEDLQRQQKATRLKAEALDNELSLDLRSDSGAARSTLLHRLRLLDVPWGTPGDAGRSRGTFRERWTLRWEPEFSVRLVEQLVHGTTIESAASHRSIEQLRQPGPLGGIVALTQQCMEAQLPLAADVGLQALAERAGHAQECAELLDALPPLIDLQRYGTAREIALDQVGALAERLCVQAALALPYAVRNLDAAQSQALADGIGGANAALQLAGMAEDTMTLWWRALKGIATHEQTAPRVSGLVSRLLYESEHLASDEVRMLMRRMLSPGIATVDAAAFFEGFFNQAAQRLLYDDALLGVVHEWLTQLEAEAFQEQLPLFRRVFSVMDREERRRLFDRVVKPSAGERDGSRLLIDNPVWDDHASRMLALLKREHVQWPS